MSVTVLTFKILPGARGGETTAGLPHLGSFRNPVYLAKCASQWITAVTAGITELVVLSNNLPKQRILLVAKKDHTNTVAWSTG